MPLVERFCCCWDLAKACVVIGYTTGGLSCTLSVGAVLRLLIGLPSTMMNDELQGHLPFNGFLFLFPSAYFAVHVIASFLLVPGVKMGRMIFMLPWIVITSLDVLLDIIAIVVLSMIAARQESGQNIYIGGAAAAGAILPFMIYCLVCVTSHFEQIFKKEKSLMQPATGERNFSSMAARSSHSSLGPSDV